MRFIILFILFYYYYYFFEHDKINQKLLKYSMHSGQIFQCVAAKGKSFFGGFYLKTFGGKGGGKISKKLGDVFITGMGRQKSFLSKLMTHPLGSLKSSLIS